MPDYYRLLEVDRSASPEVIRKAYRVLAARYHPDSAGGRSDARRMRELNEAYSTLSDPERRAAYDRRRAYGGVPSGRVAAEVFWEEGLVGLARRWLAREGAGR